MINNITMKKIESVLIVIALLFSLGFFFLDASITGFSASDFYTFVDGEINTSEVVVTPIVFEENISVEEISLEEPQEVLVQPVLEENVTHFEEENSTLTEVVQQPLLQEENNTQEQLTSNNDLFANADCGGVTPCACGDTITSSYTLTADLDCSY